MKIRNTLRNLINRFFIFYTFSTIPNLVCLYCLGHEKMISIVFLFKIMMLAAFADVLTLLFDAAKELPKKKFIIRTIFNFILIDCILLAAVRYIFGRLSNPVLQVLLAFELPVVYWIVLLFDYSEDSKTADDLNRKIKEHQQHLR